MDKRVVAILSIIIILLAGLAIYYLVSPRGETLTIRAGTLQGGISTLDVMENKSLGEKYGFNLQVLRFQKTPDIIAALSNGEVDVAVIPAEMAAKLIQSNVNVTIFAVDMYQNQGILTLSSDINSPEDLVGRKVGVVAASGTYKMFKAYMGVVYNISVNEESTVVSDKINIVNVPPPLIVDALVNGDVDAIVIWEPFVSVAVVKHDARFVANYSELWRKMGKSGDPVMLVWVARSELVGSKILDNLAKAREEAAKIWVSDKDYTLSLLISLYNLDEEVANFLYNRVKISTVNLNGDLESNIREVWWLAWKGGYLPEDPSTIGEEAFYIPEGG